MNKEVVRSSDFNITEERFRDFFMDFANCSEKYENNKKIIIYTLYRIIDNKFNLSYHLTFPEKKVQFNFWFDKISFINSEESVTISFYNSNEKFVKNKLKNLLTTKNLDELKNKVNEIFKQYE